MRASRLAPWALLGVALLLGACAGSGTPRDKITYFTLEYAAPAPSEKPPLPVIVKVERFMVSPVYNSTAILYSGNSYTRDAYVYYKWRANPGDLVSQFIGRDLRSSGRFEGVVPGGSRLEGSYLMEGSVDEFLERDTEKRWEAVLRISVTMSAENEPDISRRVLFQKSYGAVKACREKTPSALAEAMSGAVQEISRSVLEDTYTCLAARLRKGSGP
jgi:ABC-type uncharacterized transport system auxiliary subunit